MRRPARGSLVRLPLVALLVALALATVGAPAGAVPATPALAADADLALVTAALYDVQPDHGRVHVTVDIVATNRKAETKTHRYYFERAYLAVLPGTSGFKVSGSGKPKVAVIRKSKAYTMLRIDFGARLYSGKQAKLRLTFDLKDPGGAATRDVRVGSSLVSFPAWAYASDGARGSSVAIRFPGGYDVTFESGALPQRDEAADGTVTYRTGALDDPLRFFAYVVAERPATYSDAMLDVPVGDASAALRLRAWADDPDWAKRVGGLFTRALPVLADDIGVPWPHETPLIVQEAVSRTTGGYAGMFDPAESRIEVAYWASHLVTIHEAAHGWFNGSLLADRWANEGFASLYAERAARALEEKGTSAELTDKVAESRVPLNAWGHTGTTDRATEAYGYAASLALARAIAERAGDDALRAVWGDARTRVGAYQPPANGAAETTGSAGAETVDAAPDWRGLLDLLEDRTGRDFTDLWRTWVVRPDEAGQLDARAAARLAYTRTLALVDGWSLPRSIRDALRAWRFDAATTLMADARSVLAERKALETAAGRAGVALPETVRDLFEAGRFADASRAAAAELAAIQQVEATALLRPVDPDPLTTIGLIGTDPESDLQAALAAIATDDLDASFTAADRATVTWTVAWQEGRRRALLGIAVLATLIVLASALFGALRRRRPVRAVAAAEGTAPLRAQAHRAADPDLQAVAAADLEAPPGTPTA